MVPANGGRKSEASAPGVVLLGVPVRFHFTFLLLILFIILAAFGTKGSFAADALVIVVLFLSVLLHELGHAVTARGFGIRTKEIVIYPIGGIAQMERQPEPKAELWIALAGPAVNFAIAGAVWAVRLAGIAPSDEGAILSRIAEGNLYLAGFNLVPAFPLDGGRVLRALLSLRSGEEAATRMAASAGKTIALMIGIYAVAQGHLFLVMIAVLIYMAAAQERVAATGRALIQGTAVRSAMVTEYHTLPHGSTMRDAADLVLKTAQQDFPVTHGDQIVGLLDRFAFVRGMAGEGPAAYVSGVMERDFAAIPPDMPLEQAMPLLGQDIPCLLVMDSDRLVGLLTRENLSEFIMLRRLGLEVPAADGVQA